LPEVVMENNEDTHRRDCECVDFCWHGDRVFPSALPIRTLPQ
jgi:hypothetical protein